MCVCVRGGGACRCVFVYVLLHSSMSKYACEFHGNSNWIMHIKVDRILSTYMCIDVRLCTGSSHLFIL